MSGIKIVKNIPLPAKREKYPSLPLEKMEVGDSFTMKQVSDRQKNAVRQQMVRFQKNNVPVKFSMQSQPNGDIRVFRVEDDQ